MSVRQGGVGRRSAMGGTVRTYGLARWGALASVGWLGAGCVGSETGNAQVYRPNREVGFALQLVHSVDEAPVAFARDKVKMVAETGQAEVSSITLVLGPGERCAKTEAEAEVIGGFVHPWCVGDALGVEGRWQVDLLTGGFDPPLSELTVPEARYVEVRVSLHAPGAAGLVLRGEISHAEVARPFDLPLFGLTAARFVAEEPVVLKAGLTGLELDLAFEDWFAELDLAPCLASEPSAERLDLSRVSQCLAVVNAARSHIATRGALWVQ